MDNFNHNLKVILADSFTLFYQNRHVHWNMRDERFYFLHRMIEEQTDSLHEFIDVLAERIRQKNDFAPKNLHDLMNMKTLKEPSQVKNGSEMLKELIVSYRHVLISLHELMDISAKNNDLVTQDILIEYARFIEKTIWILESHQN